MDHLFAGIRFDSLKEVKEGFALDHNIYLFLTLTLLFLGLSHITTSRPVDLGANALINHMLVLHEKLLLQLGLLEVRVFFEVECQVKTKVFFMLVHRNVLEIAKDWSVLFGNSRGNMLVAAHCF